MLLLFFLKGMKQIKYIKGKEKLSLVQIRKYFQEKRKKVKENDNVDLINQPKEMIIFKYADGDNIFNIISLIFFFQIQHKSLAKVNFYH